MQRADYWQCGDARLDLSRPIVMGILNVTPDSFSDGGRYVGVEAACRRAQQMIREGAGVIDVGGESTRPGADAVCVRDELDRVIPVVKELSSQGVIVSVDTTKPEVMSAALEAGAKILNDVMGFRLEGAEEVAATCDCGLVVMHMRGTPRTMQAQTDYPEGVVSEVESFLYGRSQALEAQGVDPSRICWDPGFGFGKTVDQNMELLAASDRFADSGYPLMTAISRKSSIGAVTGCAQPTARVMGSVVGAFYALERGARILRVHDVLETVQACHMFEALSAAQERN